MSTKNWKSRGRFTALACGVLAAAIGTTVAIAGPAQAHGNVNDPIARGYRCDKVWGTKWTSASLKTEDPMCYLMFQTNSNAVWQWNGLLRDGLGANYKASVPDGTLCSGGHAAGGTYDVLDTPGAWVATAKPTKFTVNLVDQASHNADYIDVYISNNSYDPLTQKLGWGNLVKVGSIGTGQKNSVTGGGVVDPLVSGKAYAIPVDVSGYTGRRVLFTVWKASHADQLYFLCSDVVIS